VSERDDSHLAAGADHSATHPDPADPDPAADGPVDDRADAPEAEPRRPAPGDAVQAVADFVDDLVENRVDDHGDDTADGRSDGG
jgi:hypothetical protein